VAGSVLSPRPLHPGAWWGWAGGAAVVASRCSNPLLLALVIAIVGVTVWRRRSAAPWALAFRLYVWVAVIVVVVRVGLRILLTADGPTVVWRLPVVHLPGVLSGVRLLGPVSAEALVGAVSSALQLAALIIAVGAANSLANPKRLLAGVPGALYEWGTVVVIAISVFPQLAESLVRVRRARRLRATARRTHPIRDIAMPVVSDALERSLRLAGAMDSRGYGRSGQVSQPSRRVSSGLLIGGSLALCVGAYGLLDTGQTPWWMGVPLLVVGLAAGAGGLRLAGRRVTRTRYRPDPWRGPEWLVLGSGLAAAAGVIVAGVVSPAVVTPPAGPLAWPPLGVLALVSVLLLGLPAVLAPRPEPRASRVPAAVGVVA